MMEWPRWESNPHGFPRPILSRVRLPFRHLAEEARAAPCVSTIHLRVWFGKPLPGKRVAERVKASRKGKQTRTGQGEGSLADGLMKEAGCS